MYPMEDPWLSSETQGRKGKGGRQERRCVGPLMLHTGTEYWMAWELPKGHPVCQWKQEQWDLISDPR